MTPEGKVKQNITRVLKSFPFVYSFMPVQHGYGAAGVDYHCVAGQLFVLGIHVEMLPIAFFIEAKKPGGEPTGRQDTFLKERREKQNCKTFVIDDDPTKSGGLGNIQELTEWLQAIEENNERLRPLTR